MKITELTTTMIMVPLKPPVHDSTIALAFGGGLFVHLKTDAGHEGLGYTYADPEVREIVHFRLKDAVVGRDPFQIERIWRDMFWNIRIVGRKGAAFNAISAVDTALWDLKAKILNLPLYKLLGEYTDEVPVYGSGGWTHFTEKELIDEMVHYVEMGIPRVKMKVAKNFGREEKEDIARVKAVRKAVGDDVEIYVDANNGYYTKQAIYMAKAFEELGVRWFEEPVLADDIDGHATVARATTIPIATGEHEYTKYGFRELMARGAADIVQPDVARLGGITEWMKVAALAEAYNLPIAPHAVEWVHLHLGCATPTFMVVEYFANKGMFKDVPDQRNGLWAPYPDKPGLGLELNPRVVQKYGT